MVVPAPNGIGLLTEHAIQEFGYSGDFEIYDFDYKMGGSSATIAHHNSQNALAFVVVMAALFGLYSALKTATRGTGPSLRSKISFQAIREQVIDIEAQIPELSHSSTTTPSGSPSISKEFIKEFSIQSFDDHRMKQS